MDEPTSSLDDREVETLFGVIRQLKAEGVSVIFVSHRLDELYAVCDRVTIMRDGCTVDERPMSEIGKLELVARMLGQESGDLGVGEGAQAGRGHGARPVPGRLAREELVLAHGVPGLDHPHHAFPAGR